MEEKIGILISIVLNYVSKGAIDKNPVLDHEMAWSILLCRLFHH